jgi:hypothetical protein
MKKILLPGLAAGLVMLLVSLIAGKAIGMLFPSITAEYQNPNLFRPWTDPLMSYIFVHPFVVGLLLAWVWHKLKGLARGKDLTKKGLEFGLAFWVVSSIPGMLISFSTFPLSLLMIASWTISGLLELLAAGVVLAHLNK